MLQRRWFLVAALLSAGPGRTYYIAGNDSDATPTINIWSSKDLLRWVPYSQYTPDLKATPGYSQALQRIGAPKIYFDGASKQVRDVVAYAAPGRSARRFREITGRASARSASPRRI